MLRAELKKCLSFRVLWILLFCLLCINGYSQITNAYNRYYTPSEYNALYEQLDGMSLQEANAFVSAKIEAASRTRMQTTTAISTMTHWKLSRDCKIIRHIWRAFKPMQRI